MACYIFWQDVIHILYTIYSFFFFFYDIPFTIHFLWPMVIFYSSLIILFTWTLISSGGKARTCKHCGGILHRQDFICCVIDLYLHLLGSNDEISKDGRGDLIGAILKFIKSTKHFSSFFFSYSRSISMERCCVYKHLSCVGCKQNKK